MRFSLRGSWSGAVRSIAAGALALSAAGTLAQVPVIAIEGLSGPVVIGTSATLRAVATDPANGALTYAWTATGGALDAHADTATWTAPEAAGDVVVQVTATSSASGLSSTAQLTARVVLAAYQAALGVPLVAPRQIRSGTGGELYVVDRQTGPEGAVLLLTPRGEARGVASVPEPALAVAASGDTLWIATEAGRLFAVDPSSGKVRREVPLADGPFSRPVAMAYEPARGALWVADAAADRVRIVRPTGETVGVITNASGVPLRGPLDVGVDARNGRVWVLGSGARPGTTTPLAASRLVHGFTVDGAYQTSIVAQGTAITAVTRASGLLVAPDGRVYVSDAFQSRVQAYRADGAALGAIGGFGEGLDQIMNPGGLALLANGDLAVADPTQGRIDRFGSGAPLPTCGDDTDCDGLPDAWELAHGLNPGWAGDAAVDTDGDGLSNSEEYALGTDPCSTDTDGDGYGDRDEVLAGYDPRDPNDHRPVLVASAPAEVDPGLVQVAAVVSGPADCSVAWRQVGGPPVVLRGAIGVSPSFVARIAATYVVEGAATCGRAVSEPVRVAVAVRNVAPRADAGRVVVLEPSSAISLDALASSDANGDALTFVWEQTLGPAVLASTSDPAVVVQPHGAGLYAFQVTTTDPKGLATTSEVPVLVAPAGAAPTALARTAPASPQPGDTVVLDATASIIPEGGGWAWTQVAGPPVSLDGTARAVATFSPPEPGRYAFEVQVGNSRLRSPPARVDVFVSEAGRALPVAVARAPAVVDAGAPFTLDGADTVVGASGASWSWRQAAGPAAGLTAADRAVATAVAFEPGFYAFELVVRSGAAESRPARVTLVARAGEAPIPVARATIAPAGAHAGDVVVLDGRASTGATRWRWIQVGGPWTPILDAAEPVASFKPKVAGDYAFELEVDDGRVRSAPARVELRVGAEEAR